jgi:CRISPR-associated protein Cas6
VSIIDHEIDPDFVDLAFALKGQAVAVAYLDRLWDELLARLPWFASEPHAAILPLAGVTVTDAAVYLSSRARLILRLPRVRVDEARALRGASFDLGGPVAVEVGEAQARPLMAATVIHSSFVTYAPPELPDEAAFVAACRAELETLALAPQMVCGKARSAQVGGCERAGFSLMLHGLGSKDSLRLQRLGLGAARQRGCGVFVPHKAVVAVSD